MEIIEEKILINHFFPVDNINFTENRLIIRFSNCVDYWVVNKFLLVIITAVNY